MAHIKYLPQDQVPPEHRVPSAANILRVHRVNSLVLRQHHELYRALMFARGPLSRVQREMIAVAVSAHNHCHY